MKVKEKVFLGFTMLLLVATLWTVPAVLVAAYRYPIASEEQIYNSVGSLLLFKRVESLDKQQAKAKTYRVTVTVTQIFVREIPALSKEHLKDRIKKHKRKLTLRAFQTSYDWDVSSIEEVKQDEN